MGHRRRLGRGVRGPGWYLATRRPGVPFGWLALAAGLGHGLSGVGLEWVVASELGGHELPAVGVAWWLIAWGSLVELPVLAATYALFPEGWLPRGWPRLAAIGACVLSAAGLAVSAVNPQPEVVADPALDDLTSGLGVEALEPVVDAVPALFAPALLLATAVLVARWRRAPGGSDARRVLGWMVPVAVLTVVVVPAAVVGLPDAAGVTVAQASTLLVMAVVVTASLRGRVYGIELVLNRALVYGGLTLVVALVYAAAIGLGAALGQGGDDAGGGASAWSFAGALAAALLLAPARLRVQAGVNRFLYGDRDEPYAVVSRVAARLGATGSAEQLLPSFVASTAAALRVPYVAVELAGNGDERRTIRHGEPPDAVDSVPLRHQGEDLGALVVGRRPGQDVVPEGERRLVEDLARQASVAAANVRLTEGLRRSRERIVTGREEERRRLRRDLHDGLGPQLTGVALGLDVLSGKVEPLNPALATNVDRLRDEVQEAIGDVRRLVHDLRPPRLDEVGLAGAVQEVAERIGRGDVEVTVIAEALPPLPAAVEVAAYRIATEALTNVVRHSGARRCTVTLAIGELADQVPGAHPPDRLEMTINDDGYGPHGEHGDHDHDRHGPIAGTGVGVSSMRERAEEIGGTCTVERHQPHGWAVVAVLPLERP